jgi:glyoxylase-like metal-dependent hydrolase (beta-lactamase superfamily II)
MEVVKLTLGSYSTHTYLVKDADFCCVIDPEINDGAIVRALDARGWNLTDILVTHAHFDHVRGINKLPQGAKLWIHEADAPYLAGRNEEIGDPFLKDEPITRPFTAFLDGDKIGPFTAMHFPGHSPGCALFICPGHIFAGDSLFVRGVPMLDFTLGDRAAYRHSLRRIGELDREALLHAGHGDEGVLREALP